MSAKPASTEFKFRSYPAIIFLYPSLLMAIICGIWVESAGASVTEPGLSGLFFTLVFFFNLTIMAFDYTRLTSIIIILSMIIFGLVSTLAPSVGDFLLKAIFHEMFMDGVFYWVWATGLAIIFVVAFIRTRFDYWEVKNNELLHHHGLLGDVKRWPAPGLRTSKEINDVMEYLLCRSGRLVLRPAQEPRDIVIENVPNINKVENRMQELLSSLRVVDGD